MIRSLTTIKTSISNLFHFILNPTKFSPKHKCFSYLSFRFLYPSSGSSILQLDFPRAVTLFTLCMSLSWIVKFFAFFMDNFAFAIFCLFSLFDESIFKSKEAKEKPCGIDEASMEKDEGAEARKWEEKWCNNGVWRSSQVRLGHEGG